MIWLTAINSFVIAASPLANALLRNFEKYTVGAHFRAAGSREINEYNLVPKLFCWVLVLKGLVNRHAWEYTRLYLVIAASPLANALLQFNPNRQHLRLSTELIACT